MRKLPYSGKLLREKPFCELEVNKTFMEKTFADCSLVSSIVPPKEATPPNFAEKTFVNRYKTLKFVKIFPSKVSH